MGATAIFSRQSIRKRGHFTNYFTIDPVTELAFEADSLRITTIFTARQYPYGSLQAEVLSTYIWKAYGAYAGAYIKQTLVSIKTPSRTYRFDLSGNFPDFAERGAILKLIDEKISSVDRSTETLSVVKRRNLIAPIILFAALILFIAISKYYGI